MGAIPSSTPTISLTVAGIFLHPSNEKGVTFTATPFENEYDLSGQLVIICVSYLKTSIPVRFRF
jgi:hypothetical protein